MTKRPNQQSFLNHFSFVRRGAANNHQERAAFSRRLANLVQPIDKLVVRQEVNLAHLPVLVGVLGGIEP